MYHGLPSSISPGASAVNWAGFYVLDPSNPEKQLILGPFMGKVACQTIRIGKGVCGTAAEGEGRTMLVTDVEQFPGHIACDSESRSEIVVPIRSNGKVSTSPLLSMGPCILRVEVLRGAWIKWRLSGRGERKLMQPGRWRDRHRLCGTQRL